MNRILLSSLVALFSISFLSAQICQPDMTYADSSFGVYPTSIEESACINQGFYFSLTFVIPETVDVGPVTANVDSIELTGVSGMPIGMAYACNPPSCIFKPEDVLACAYIYGTATSDNMVGDFELELEGSIGNNLTAAPIPFSQVFSALGIENYTLTLEEENSTNCFITNTEELLNEQVRIETSPNPFSYGTNISIYSEKVNENLELSVHTMLGERVHFENINLTHGTNTVSFDGSHLSEGIYFFNFSDGNSMLTQKMIIKR